jgi:hypothetical protein
MLSLPSKIIRSNPERGADILSAEIIPVEPDSVSTDVGRELFFNSSLLSIRIFDI